MSSLFGGGSKPPKPTKPADVLNAAVPQQKAEIGLQQEARDVDQSNIYGNQLTWTQGPDGRWQQNISQGSTGQQFAGGLSGLGQSYITGAQDFLGNRPDMSGMAAFDQANTLWSNINEPRLQRARDTEMNRLKNMGFSETDEGYKNAMSDQALQQDAARQQFQLGAQGQMFNQAQQDRQNQLGELSSLTQPGLQYGLGAATNQGFGPVQGINVSNLSGAIPGMYSNYDQQRMAAWQQQQAQQQAMFGDLANLAGTGASMFMLSDERAKEDIRPVGKLKGGLAVYAYRYKGDPKTQIGVMAQEAEKKAPEAVAEIGGLKHVNYGALVDALAE